MIPTMQHTLTLVKESMKIAQNQAKFYKDKNHTLQKFEMNDGSFYWSNLNIVA